VPTRIFAEEVGRDPGTSNAEGWASDEGLGSSLGKNYGCKKLSKRAETSVWGFEELAPLRIHWAFGVFPEFLA